MESNYIDTLKKICSNICSVLPSSSVWEMDDRYNTATTSFEKNFSEEIFSHLTNEFTQKWDKKTARKASKSIKETINSISGINSGQFIFTMDDDSNPMLFAAWWPWGNDINISLRIGIFDPSLQDEEIKDFLTEWFKL